MSAHDACEEGIQDIINEILSLLWISLEKVNRSKDHLNFNDFRKVIESLSFAEIPTDTLRIVENGICRTVSPSDPVPPDKYGFYSLDENRVYRPLLFFSCRDIIFFDPELLLSNRIVMRFNILEVVCKKVVERFCELTDETLKILRTKYIVICILRTLNELSGDNFRVEVCQLRTDIDFLERIYNVKPEMDNQTLKSEYTHRLYEYRWIGESFFKKTYPSHPEHIRSQFAQAVARLMVPEAEIPWEIHLREHLAVLTYKDRDHIAICELLDELSKEDGLIFGDLSASQITTAIPFLLFQEKKWRSFKGIVSGAAHFEDDHRPTLN